MTREEIRLQVAISVIQGVLEAKHGVIGEIVPSVAVAIALRIADAFVEEWYRETKEQPTPSCKTCDFYENNCPFLCGKLIPYPNKVCEHYTCSVMKKQLDVDLEKEMVAYIEQHFHIRCDETLEVDNDPLTTYDFEEIARHFYELGLNARKEK